MKKSYSNLTFRYLTKDLLFIKVFWNGKLVYDDTGLLPLIAMDVFDHIYGGKIVYRMDVQIVEFHHCILRIKGEDVNA